MREREIRGKDYEEQESLSLSLSLIKRRKENRILQRRAKYILLCIRNNRCRSQFDGKRL